MAPIDPELQIVQEDIKNVIQDLFQVLVQVSNYDAAGRPTRDVLAQDVQTLSTTLHHLHSTTAPLTTPPSQKPIPEPLIHYVENGRNPDIYTREFVEQVRRMNQLGRGKAHAFRGFRDVLARELGNALPEVAGDVQRVLEGTGGRTTTEGGDDDEGEGGGERKGEGQGQQGQA